MKKIKLVTLFVIAFCVFASASTFAIGPRSQKPPQAVQKSAFSAPIYQLSKLKDE